MLSTIWGLRLYLLRRRRAARSQAVAHVTVRVVAPSSGDGAQGVPPLAPALWSSGPPDEVELESMRLPRQKLELLGARRIRTRTLCLASPSCAPVTHTVTEIAVLWRA